MLEEKLTNEIPNLGYENVARIKIADIQFSFNNGQLINILKQRGLKIKTNDWSSMSKLDDQLDHLKDTQLEKLIVPVSAFITFESEEGY